MPEVKSNNDNNLLWIIENRQIIKDYGVYTNKICACVYVCVCVCVLLVKPLSEHNGRMDYY